MKLIIQKTSTLQGEIIPPASKSQSIRAILLATLAKGESSIRNFLHAEDIDDAIQVSRSLGAHLTINSNQLSIKSDGVPFRTIPTAFQVATRRDRGAECTNTHMSTETRYCGLVPAKAGKSRGLKGEGYIFSGNSGITTHFLMPLLGLRKNHHELIILDCGEQMRARPVKPLVEALINLGLTIEFQNAKDTLPIKINGELRGGSTEVDGATSQYLSALLFALPCAQNDSEITVRNLQERSYVDMTLNFLKQQQIQYQHTASKDIDTYHIKGRQSYQPIQLEIPIDFSSASYLIAASVLISGKVIIKNIDMNEPQGDKKLIPLLQEMGADISLHANQLTIQGGLPLRGIRIDANDIPDLLPTLSVIGAYATGKTEIVNVAHARIKETDRIHSMATGLTRMGAKLTETEDSLTIYHSSLTGNAIEGYGDHRTIMAFSIAGLIAEGETSIDHAEAINKTFPTFITLMQSIGAQMEVADA